MPSSTLAAASTLFLAMTVAGQTTTASTTAATTAAAESNSSSTAPASSTITTSASLSASGSGTYIPIFEAGPTTLGLDGAAASIVGVDPYATTLHIVCTDTAVCGSDGTITLTEGPSTWAAAYATKYDESGATVSVEISQVCNIVSSTEAATCTVTGIVSAEYDGESSKTTTTATETFSSSEIYYDQLLVTAGVDKLNNPSATSTPTGAAAPLPSGNIGMNVGGVAAAAAVAVAGLL